MEKQDEYSQFLEQIQARALNQRISEEDAGMMGESPEDEDFSKWILNTQRTIDKVVNTLAGNVSDGRGGFKAGGVRLANDNCIALVKATLEANLDYDVLLTNFKEERVRMIAKMISDVLTEEFFERWADFELDKYSGFVIMNIVQNKVDAALYRAMNAGEKGFLKPLEKTVRHIMTRMGGDNQGGFNPFNKGGPRV